MISWESFQSSEMFFSCMIWFTNSVFAVLSSIIAVIICLPPASTISTVRFGWPPAFPCFIFLTAAVTLTSVTNTAEPSTATVIYRVLISGKLDIKEFLVKLLLSCQQVSVIITCTIFSEFVFVDVFGCLNHLKFFYSQFLDWFIKNILTGLTV